MRIQNQRIAPIALLSLLIGLAGLWIASATQPAEADLSTNERIALRELGRRLFFDPVVSRSGERACASCHDPDYGFSDPDKVSADDVGNTVRHSQTILDSALNPTAHWDGEFDAIEDLVTARVGLPQAFRSTGGGYGRGPAPLSPGHSATPAPPGGDEAGGAEGEQASAPGRRITDLDLNKLPRAQDVLETAGRYADGFRAVWGNEKVTRVRISRAIAAYCRSIRSTRAPYDEHAAGKLRAISASALRGKALFEGRAGCAQCHVSTMPTTKKHDYPKEELKPVFTDYTFHNTGVAWLDVLDVTVRKLGGREAASRMEKQRARFGAHISKSEHRGRDTGAQMMMADPGRGRLNANPKELRAFKTPTLRDVTRRGPYMHNGVFQTLEEVVRYYAAGGSDDPEKDARLKPFEVTDQDVKDLVAFLESLTGTERPGLATEPCALRPKQTELRFVNANGTPMAGLAVKLLPVGDRLPLEKSVKTGVLELRTDPKGWILYAPPANTHYRIELPEALEPQGGALVPDICRKADVVVPVRGRTRVLATLRGDREAPERLIAEHRGTLVLPGHLPPRTRLCKKEIVSTGDVQVVAYEGWLRTDVPTKVTIRAPGASRRKTAHTVQLKAKSVVKIDLTR